MNTRTLIGILLAGVAATAAAQGGDFRWTGKLAPGKRLEIKGVNGDVRATAATDDQITVIAHKHARRSDPDDVKIEVVPFEGGVTICAVYPTPRRAREENDCASGDSWHSNTENNDVQVDFTVSVPKGVEFDGQTVNGEASAEGLTANVTLATVNGGITLDLPSDLSTEVRASTVNGDLVTDFPLLVTGKFGPRHLHGTIGKGGRQLSLSTVNGSIRLRKAT